MKNLSRDQVWHLASMGRHIEGFANSIVSTASYLQNKEDWSKYGDIEAVRRKLQEIKSQCREVENVILDMQPELDRLETEKE